MSYPRTVEQANIELVAYHDLNDRPGFKIAIQQIGERWFLYLGHLWHRGWSVMEVTDPYDPSLLNYIEGPKNTWTIQVQAAEGKLITALEKPTPGWGVDPDAPFEEGALIWDIATDPANPHLLGNYRTGGTGTHRNFYSGGNYVYMTANPEGFYGGILTIVDISDPGNPTEISRWSWPGQNVSSGETPEFKSYLHGPAYVVGNRAYLSYGQVGMVILDISDIRKPQLISRVSFGDLGSFLGCHSAIPIPERNLAIVNSEAILEGTGDQLNYVFIVDISDEGSPKLISSFPGPLPTNGLPYKNYFEKGGRFGPHNQHHFQGQKCCLNTPNITYLTYFNAGLRIFSTVDPYSPTEIAHFVPEDPKKRIGVLPTQLVTQFEDVLVDSRGFIYCTDKNYGLFVLRLKDPQIS